MAIDESDEARIDDLLSLIGSHQGAWRQGDPDRRRRQPGRAAPAPAQRRGRIRALPAARGRAAGRGRAAEAPRGAGGRPWRRPRSAKVRLRRRTATAWCRGAGPGGRRRRDDLAVNLAWELATIEKDQSAPRVCLLDLGLQFGSVATYLDLPRREPVLEMLSDAETHGRGQLRPGAGDVRGQAVCPDRAAGHAAAGHRSAPEEVQKLHRHRARAFRLRRGRHAADAGAMVRDGADGGAGLFRDRRNRHALGPEHAAAEARAASRGSALREAALRAEPRAEIHRPAGQEPGQADGRKPRHPHRPADCPTAGGW